MPTYPTEPALEAAVVAHADEDTPRLAYADWLDEHGDPDRAAFIRAQCRLADLSPAEPDWIDLREQQLELAARLRSRFLIMLDDTPERFYTGSDLLGHHEEPFRRGFPYSIDCQTDGEEWTAEETARVAADLARLVRTTTVRGFHPYGIPARALAALLAAPVAAELTGLSLMPHPTYDWRAEAAEYYRLVAHSPAMRRVQNLFLYGGYAGTPPVAVAELVKATALGAVRRLTLQDLTAPAAVLDKLTKAPWFRRLRHFRCNLEKPAVAVPMIAGLGRLPALHTLDLTELPPGAVATLAAGKFPALARLLYGGPLVAASAKKLAAANFPALTAFVAGGGFARNDGLIELLKADWFARLRVLDLSDNGIGDKGVKALAAHPVARTLRALRLGDNTFGAGALPALTRDGAFPELTTLDLGSYHKRKGTPAELAAWLATLRLPRLRHLDLRAWPLGNAGAKALAANPTLAGLTRLTLEDCGIGDPGARALFASPHLQNLVELQMSYNSVKEGADALTDPKTMPRLGECWLSGNRIPQKAAPKLERDDLYLIT